MMNDDMNSGAITGALDPNSNAADEHAKQYYEFVRSTTSDIKTISVNTGIDSQTIETVKNYLFIDEHDLGGVTKRFDPNYEISQSWQRLWHGENILKHDLTLIQHEIYERELVKSGISQGKAHLLASQKYNYTRELRGLLCCA